ncbi:uncharacterized protein LOC125374418 [Haliotis rufescens]|uniref:uncharacterized protein LOC125374418 n=1 Tax=Haliotis rufescens TaxID=6454 RepID=UPI00201F52C4|nr:uncharacterized protein LOC125374418 [Haliotis rufescens]
MRQRGQTTQNTDGTGTTGGYKRLKMAADKTKKAPKSGFGRHHKLLGFPDPTDDFLLRKMLKGMRNMSSMDDSRAPFTLCLLEKLMHGLQHARSSRYEACLFEDTFSLTFFGSLRINWSWLNSVNSQTYHFVVCCLQFEVILVNSTKVLSSSTFLHYSTSPVTQFQFRAVLAKALRFIGCSTSSYKSHSFRTGAATTAAIQGIPEQTIKEWGRWKSNAFKSYIKINLPKFSISSSSSLNAYRNLDNWLIDCVLGLQKGSWTTDRFTSVFGKT